MELHKCVPDSFSRRAKLAATVALDAGEILLSYYDSRTLSVSGKGENDLVTEADYASETHIRKLLSAQYPEDGFIGEESGFTDLSHEYTWVTDPLDGTVNFAHGLPDFAVSIGCLKDGKPEIGVVYVPCCGCLIVGERGKGVYKNGQAVSVTETDDLSSVLLGMDFAHRSYTSLPEHLALYHRLLPLVSNIVKPESAVMTTAYCACGRYGAVYEQSLCLWDIAATALLLEEAGAVVTDRFGDPIVYDRDLPYSFVAACPAIHRQLIQAARDIKNL